jgi:hypothetical protein
MSLWLHPNQKNGGRVEGSVILAYLKRQKMMAECLTLDDLKDIQEREDPTFKKNFKGKAVFGWGSVIEDIHDGILKVPYIIEYRNKIMLEWRALQEYWDGHGPAGLWPKLHMI